MKSLRVRRAIRRALKVDNDALLDDVAAYLEEDDIEVVHVFPSRPGKLLLKLKRRGKPAKRLNVENALYGSMIAFRPLRTGVFEFFRV